MEVRGWLLWASLGRSSQPESHTPAIGQTQPAFQAWPSAGPTGPPQVTRTGDWRCTPLGSRPWRCTRPRNPNQAFSSRTGHLLQP
eukprot:jgi/Botrbrau1/8208/Bobra.0392s0006.1